MPETTVDMTAEQLLSAAREADAATGMIEPESIPPVEVAEEPESKPEGEPAEADPEVPPEPQEEIEIPAPETPEPAVEPDKDAETGEKTLDEGEKPEPKAGSKWAKNRARQEKTWNAINERKTEQDKRESELVELQQDLERQREKLADQTEYRDAEGYTAQDYEGAAKEFKESGEEQFAREAGEKASEVREKERVYKTESKVKSDREMADKTRDKVMAGLLNKHPELKDANSELTTVSNAILQQYPILQYDPHGPQYAVDVAQLRLKAQKAENLESELGDLTEKYEKLEKKTAVTGGFTPEKPDGAPAGFDDLPSEDQEKYLRDAAHNADTMINH